MVQLTFAMIADLVRAEAKALGTPFYESGDYDLNLFGIRSLSSSNRFDDVIGAICKVAGVWTGVLAPATTEPGRAAWERPAHPGGVAILRDGYHPKLWEIGPHKGQYDALVQRVGAIAEVVRDDNRDANLNYTGSITTATGINLHHAGPDSRIVDRWSEGCQVVQRVRDHDSIMGLARAQRDQRGWATFSYTIFNVARSPRLEAILLAGRAS